MADANDDSLIIIDAVPLITALKIQRFDLFSALAAFPVCTEHARTLCHGTAVLGDLDDLLTQGTMREIPILDPTHHRRIATLVDSGLSYAEASSLTLACERDAPVILDDRHAIKIARKLKIRVLTTTDVVATNIRRGALTVVAADQLIAHWRAVKEIPVTVQSFQELVPL